MDVGFARAVYARTFLRMLIPKALRMAERDPTLAELVDLERLQKATTLGSCIIFSKEAGEKVGGEVGNHPRRNLSLYLFLAVSIFV